MRLRRRRRPAIPGAEIGRLHDETTVDRETGAVTSRQTADIVLPAAALAPSWSAADMERVARSYWTTLRRFTLGLIHVEYTPTERAVVFLIPRLRLLTFKAPEYEVDAHRGVVRWRIEKGVLVSRRGRGGDGYLEIDIRRDDEPERGKVRLRVAVEVANYYPALGGLSRRLYSATQSRIHVVSCNYFLRRGLTPVISGC
ncbi:MAG TPA: hypothetical protein VHA76_13405 [Solirubrobacterales bacterium]|nr:hypothetical protein [Solirubrobacterales bacterium]